MSLPDATFTVSDAGSYSEGSLEMVTDRWDSVEVSPTSETGPGYSLGTQTQFEAELMGSYVMQLHVFDERGVRSETPCSQR